MSAAFLLFWLPHVKTIFFLLFFFFAIFQCNNKLWFPVCTWVSHWRVPEVPLTFILLSVGLYCEVFLHLWRHS